MATIDSELKLKRFMYFCSEESRYTATKKNCYENICELNKITCLFELITADKENAVLDLIDSVKDDLLISRRETLLFILAALTRNAKSEKIKTLTYNKVLEVCNSSEELFLFIKFAHSLNKNFSHGMRRIINSYYLNREPMDLLSLIITCNSCFGWSHKDVFTLTHIKPKNAAQEIIVIFVMRGLKESYKYLEDKEKENYENMSLLHDIYNNLKKYDSLRHCQIDQDVVALITENNYKIQQIPSQFLKSQIVWESLISNVEITELLPELMRLNRLGFLKSNSPNSLLHKVIEILSDTKKCISSKVQPVQALIYLKTFERGKPIDAQKKAYLIDIIKTENQDSEAKSKKLLYYNPPKNNAIISALYKLLHHSFKNLTPTGRRFLITMDVKDDNMKSLCITNKVLTCLEVAVLIALSFVKVERDVTVAAYNGEDITVIPIDRSLTYPQTLQKVKEIKWGPVVLNNTFNWATKNNKPVDVFINLLYSADCLHRVPKSVKSTENIITSLKKYRQKLHLQNSKMVNVSLGGKQVVISDGSSHILDICGFDNHVPKIIESCCKGVVQ